MTYGFPSEGPAPDSPVSPTPRIFVGNFQRFFEYRSPAGYAYLAAELSGTAPSGLSGGPIFRQGAPQMLTGMVTANVESYAITDSLEEMREGGEVFRLESRRVISYGIGLLLGTVSDWLHEVIPERPGMAGSPDDEARPERVCPVRWHGIVRASFSPIFRGSPFAANRTSAFVVPPVSFPTIAWATPRSRAPPARDDSFATVPIVASTALVVTVGDQRTVCSPQPAAADRRPPARGACAWPERTQRGLAAWLRRIHRSVDRKRPHHFENAETCVAAGSGRQLRRAGRGRRRATRAKRFGVLRCLDAPPVTSTELRQRRTRGSRLANLRRPRRG